MKFFRYFWLPNLMLRSIWHENGFYEHILLTREGENKFESLPTPPPLIRCIRNVRISDLFMKSSRMVVQSISDENKIVNLIILGFILVRKFIVIRKQQFLITFIWSLQISIFEPMTRYPTVVILDFRKWKEINHSRKLFSHFLPFSTSLHRFTLIHSMH